MSTSDFDAGYTLLDKQQEIQWKKELETNHGLKHIIQIKYVVTNIEAKNECMI